MTRCEGWEKSGSFMSFGRPEWHQCTNDARVRLLVQQEAIQSSQPACIACWRRAIHDGIHIVHAEPISLEPKEVE